MNFLTVNKLILKAINSQSKETFCMVMEKLVRNKVTGLFTKKRYLWNIIRPRDMYKMIAYWIETNISDRELFNERIRLMHELIESTKDEKIRKSFVWGLLKRVNLLTVYTIQYASQDKINNIVAKLAVTTDLIYVDETLYPLVYSYRQLAEYHKREVDDLNKK